MGHLAAVIKLPQIGSLCFRFRPHSAIGAATSMQVIKEKINHRLNQKMHKVSFYNSISFMF